MTKKTFEEIREKIYKRLDNEWIAIGQDIMFQFEDNYEYETIQIGEDIKISLQVIQSLKELLEEIEEQQKQEEAEIK